MAVLKGIARSIKHNCSGDYRDARALIGREQYVINYLAIIILREVIIIMKH